MGLFNIFSKKTEQRAVNVNGDLVGQDYTGNSFLNLNHSVNSIPITETSALRLSAVWACVRIKSNQLATLPFNFYIRDEKGDSVIAKSSSAQRVMKRPNSFMSSFDFKFAMMAAKMLHGNGYARIIRDSDNEPIELIPLHPSRVEPQIKGGKLVYLVDSDFEIAANDMLHFKGVTMDGIIGMSTIKVEAQNLGLALASQNELKTFYEKGSKIDGFVSYPNKLESGAKLKSEQALINKI
jgi:HK97 family phage portal protein